jgi:acyl-CoA synthetase (AMP-forming)/AMP-acid ligase II
MTLPARLARAAALARAADGLRFVDRDERATFFGWAEVHARALRAAGALAEAGVRPGDRVAIVVPTDPVFFDAFFGAQLCGAVPVPLYPPVRLGRLGEYFDRTAAMLRAVDAVALVADRRVRRVLGQVVARWRPRLGVLDAEDLAKGHARAPADVRPGDLAMVQFSSGTTADPKPVALTHEQTLANCDAIVDVILRHLPADEVSHGGASWLPLYHDMGLIGCVFPALTHPAALTLMPPEAFLARPALWLRTIARYGATVSPAPDFAYALCAARVADAELDGCDLSCWRLALDGAEPISPRTLRTFAARFARFGLRPEALTPVYGLSEAALAVTFSDPARPPRTLRVDRGVLAAGRTQFSESSQAAEVVSVGRPLRGFDVEVRRPDGMPAREGIVGRVWVRGPSVMAGYLGRPERPVVDGWLDTGDQGFVRGGELYVTGRAKDVIILRGRNHAPQDVERAIDEVAGVRPGCAAAVGAIDEEGEHLLLFVEARDPHPGLDDACRAAVRAATGLDPYLVFVLPPGTLPRTSSGKIRRGETLRRWREGTLTPPAPVNALTMAGALARSAVGYLTSGR